MLGIVRSRTAGHSVSARYGAIAAPPWCVIPAARCETQATNMENFLSEFLLRHWTPHCDLVKVSSHPDWEVAKLRRRVLAVPQPCMEMSWS